MVGFATALPTLRNLYLFSFNTSYIALIEIIEVQVFPSQNVQYFYYLG